MEQQLQLKVLINRNNVDDLDMITILIREGWNLIHFNLSTEQEDRDTKVVLTRDMQPKN